jgi:hypothetical protein
MGVIDEVMRHLHKVALHEIDIAECHSPLAADRDKESASRLAHLIRSAFLAQRVKSDHIKIERGLRSLTHLCLDFGQKSDAMAYVAVGVLVN